MKIESYYINKDGVEGLVKSAGIWGINGNTSFPLVYLKKPKHLDEGKFQEIVDSIVLNLPLNFETETKEPIKVNDLVRILEDFTKGKIGKIVSLNDEGKIKVDFDDGWVGWYYPEQLEKI